MNKIDIKWGNIELPGLSDEELYSKQFREIKTDSSKQKISNSMKGIPKSDSHKNALSTPKINKGDIGKSKSKAKIEACKRNARLGGLTGAGAKATKEKYSKAIICYLYPTMKLHSEFESIKEAARILGINAGNISNLLNGKGYQTKGYFFKYKD